MNIFPDQATILLERNGKGCERLHPMMSSVSTGESTSTIISTTHDGNPRLTFRQNCDGSSYRLYQIQQGEQTYPDHHRPTNGLARSDTNPEQVCRHNHQGIHQTLLTQTHVPPVHTIRQWHGVQEPDLQQSHKGSWHQEDILCTIPPSKQWKARNIPQIPQTNTKEDVC